MRLVIFAGGLGTRLSEETHLRPKPMVELNGLPILLHIMNYYAKFSVNEFLILGGYKCYAIKEYFFNYCLHRSDVTFDFSSNSHVFHKKNVQDWKVTVIDTGLNTNTAGRLMLAKSYLKEDETFFLTYGDGLSDVNLQSLSEFHVNSGLLATMTTTIPEGRFGAVDFDGHESHISRFVEKPKNESGWINAGFFVINSKIVDFITRLDQSFEYEILPQLASRNLLAGYKHYGFFHPMDSLRDKNYLSDLIDKGEAPWI